MGNSSVIKIRFFSLFKQGVKYFDSILQIWKDEANGNRGMLIAEVVI